MRRSARRIVGFLDEVTFFTVRGWCRAKNHLDPVEVQVKVNGVPRVSGIANDYREDIKLKGHHPTGNCAFELNVPDLKEGDLISVWVPEAEQELTHSPKVVGEQRTICYLHVPKSGGTAVNAYFQNCFGPAQVETHIENLIDAEVIEAICAKRVVSGHVSYSVLKRKVGRQPVFWITVLREPFAQLVSHVAWVRNLANPKQSDALSAYPAYVQKLAAKLAAANLADAADVHDLFADFEPVELRLFDNVQVRYFCELGVESRVEEAHLVNACDVLANFLVVGLTERMDETVRLIDARLGVGGGKMSRVNVSTCKYGLDENSPALRAVLESYCQFDVELYRHATELFEDAVQRILHC